MSDLVERLQGAYSTVFERSMAKEAADEIERLRKQIALLDGDVDREAKRAERAEARAAGVHGARGCDGGILARQ